MIIRYILQKSKNTVYRFIVSLAVCSMLCALYFLPSQAQASAEWEVTLRVEAGTGHNQLILGADNTATDGYDPVWEVYAMLGGQIEAYFPHPEWNMVHQVFWREIKAKAPGVTTEWSFVVDSSLNTYNFIIRWDLSKIPESYMIFLRDDSAAKQIDMRLTDSYSFLFTGSRTFGVTVYIPPDVAPPDPPQRLRGKSNQTGVILSWKRNHHVGLAGCNVYRSVTHGSGYQRITSSLITETKYFDNQIANKTTYYYVVTAVNASGVESGFSNEVAVTTK